MSNVSLIDGHIDDTPRMTDNEIIEALEGKRPLGMCAIQGAIDLINRQKAEIKQLTTKAERLQKHMNWCRKNGFKHKCK